MMRILVSVRDPAEALVAASGGADFIDLKEPGQGALGGLPVETIRAIVAALRGAGSQLAISATIGDVPMHARDEIERRVRAVGACGVDYVKVGIERTREAHEVLALLASLPLAIVPVFIADRGLDDALVAQAVSLGFPGQMADTADKRAGSLFDVATDAELHAFVARVRSSAAIVGLAGALRLHDLPRLVALAPDFGGFRSAVCAGDRAGTLERDRLEALVAAVRAAERAAQQGSGRVSPSSIERMRSSSAL
jgi:(5-formylfuran-3-yl)methyl phosphate synthase